MENNILPDGWEWTTFGAVIEKMSNGTTATQTKEQDGVPVSRIETISQGKIDLGRIGYIQNASPDLINKYKLQKGDLLFSNINSDIHLGKTALFELEGITLLHGMNLLLLRPNADTITPRFLHYLCNHYRSLGRFIAVAQHAVNQSSINQTKLKQITIPLPPIPEQERIVSRIEELFSDLEAGVAALERVRAGLKRYKASVLKAACEGKLVDQELNNEPANLLLRRIDSQRRAQWEEQSREVETKKKPKYQEPQQIDNPKLYKLPTGWTWVTLDEIGQEGRPIIYGIIKPGPHIPDGVPYVRVTEMKDGFIDVSLLRKTSVERVRKFSRATLKAGDLLISKDGTIGRVAVVPPELEGGNITQHVMRAPIHSFVNRNYIILAVQSPYCQGWLTGETRGVALQGVNVEDFRRLPIPLPPLSEQKQIVAEVERRLSVVGEVESAVDGGLVRAARLRQSVLKSAFEGRLL